MSRFRETELTENLKEFENEDKIELMFERGIDGKIIIEQGNVKYDEKYGFINIKGKNCEFQINTTLVEKYEKNKDNIEINMESIVLTIKKYNIL